MNFLFSIFLFGNTSKWKEAQEAQTGSFWLLFHMVVFEQCFSETTPLQIKSNKIYILVKVLLWLFTLILYKNPALILWKNCVYACKPRNILRIQYSKKTRIFANITVERILLWCQYRETSKAAWHVSKSNIPRRTAKQYTCDKEKVAHLLTKLQIKPCMPYCQIRWLLKVTVQWTKIFRTKAIMWLKHTGITRKWLSAWLYTPQHLRENTLMSCTEKRLP